MSSSNTLKAKPSSSSFSRKPDGSSSSKGPTPSLPSKKIQTSTKLQTVDSKTKFVSKITKSEVKPSSSSKTSLKTTTTSTKTAVKVTRRAKKVYSLAGQKFDPPEEREPLRIFYESLSKQIPSSEMAEFWLMEHGLLSSERSKRAHEKKQRRQKQLKMGIPMKPPPRPNKPESSTRQPQGAKNPHPQGAKNNEIKSKKRIANDSDDDDDFILSIKRRKG